MQPAHRHMIECDAGNPAAPTDSPPELERRVALGQFDADVRAWLQDGFKRRVVGGLPLDMALRLDRASRKRARDDALRRAADMLRLGNAGPWVVAGRLLQAVKRHHRMRDAPATMLEIAVGEACTAGVRVPDSQQGLFDIITG